YAADSTAPALAGDGPSRGDPRPLRGPVPSARRKRLSPADLDRRNVGAHRAPVQGERCGRSLDCDRVVRRFDGAVERASLEDDGSSWKRREVEGDGPRRDARCVRPNGTPDTDLDERGTQRGAGDRGGGVRDRTGRGGCDLYGRREHDG